jgi:hypothetical protein
MQQPIVPAQRPTLPRLSILLLVLILAGCSVYANLSFAVKDRKDYRYFPPFRPYADFNMNDHLGAEYLNVGRSLLEGKGFADPFTAGTGPTAWMPPVFPSILAGVLWLTAGNPTGLMATMIFLQVLALVATGLLVLSLSWRSGSGIGMAVSAAIFVVVVISDFFLWFQFTHDMWLVLLALDLLIAVYCWYRPLRQGTIAWGFVGGVCALINPVVGGAWAVLSVVDARRERAWSRLALAAAIAVLVVLPWTVRNFVVFGRFIPVKSNLAFELYQSQCLTDDGLLMRDTFYLHPYTTWNQERIEYTKLGESAYLDRKQVQFRDAVTAHPLELLRRIGNRFVAATLRYSPFDEMEEREIPEWVFLRRLVYPLPFVSLLLLAGTSFWKPLGRIQWGVIAVYLAYLTPYIAISYYDRYAVPLAAVKAVLVYWAVERLVVLWPRRAEQATTNREKLRNLASVSAIDVAREGATAPVCPVGEGAL